MLGLILIVVLFAVVLGVLLWIGTVWFQGYIYSEPVAGAYWRGPLAAGVLTLLLAFWSVLNYRSLGNYPGQFLFPSGDVKEVSELWGVSQGKETHYKRKKRDRGLPDYLDSSGRPWRRSEAILIEEDGQKVRFEADKDEKGNYKAKTGRSLRYVDERGREMYEEPLGQLKIARRGLFWANVGLNLFHLVVWFLALWLLLRFQWSHALGLAIVFWLVMTFTIGHLILQRAEEVGRQRATAVPATAATTVPRPARRLLT